ncbi:MAG: argininosuccinate lyase [Planctomycetota bacterium]
MSGKTWGGRFTGGTDQRVEHYTESISYDQRLWKHDIQASKAHSTMLSECGLITVTEAGQIHKALDEIGDLIDQGNFEYSTSLEDIHTHIESALIKKLGDVGRKLHTARSRNDQVITDVKLWVRESIGVLDEKLKILQRSLVESARKNHEVVLPGYTHLQRAQPVLASHYFLAYVEKFQRDRDRLSDCRKRVNILPLGAAALAGTSLPINRQRVAEILGFDVVAANSLDVSSDRDFLVEFLGCLVQIALHLGGWSEEWILWSTTEFNFLDLPDSFCTGSSIMPHKKNPDVLELMRGKTGRVIASLTHLMVMVKGLPLAYNRDLQEDKVALFDAFDTVAASLDLASPLVDGTTFRLESIRARLEQGFLDATTFMEYLIQQGMPMRSAHEAVGKLVRSCEQKGCTLAQLPPEAFEEIHPGLSRGVYNILGVSRALEAFKSFGSTAPALVAKQVTLWQDRLA